MLQKTNRGYAKRGYSRQVPPLHISTAFTDLFANQAVDRTLGGQGHHTDEVDVMVLIDVSSSMGWEHYGFVSPLILFPSASGTDLNFLWRCDVDSISPFISE